MLRCSSSDSKTQNFSHLLRTDTQERFNNFLNRCASCNVLKYSDIVNQQSPLVGAPLAPTMFKLAVPGVIGALLFSALSMAEAGFLKNAGVDALAAVAVVFPLIMLAAMFSAGAIGGAVSGLTARAIGAGDHQEASAVLVCAVILSFLGGALLWLLVSLFGSYLFQLASDEETIKAAAIQYCSIVFPAMPAFWLINMLCSVLRGAGDMMRPAVVAAVMFGVYCVLAMVLIPESGTNLPLIIDAAAKAMVGAYGSALVLTIYFILEPRQPVNFVWSAFNKHTLARILKQGLLASSQSVMMITYAIVTTLLFSRFGTDWLAGFGLAVRLELIMVPVIFGVGASLIAIVGAYVGAGERARAITIAWRGILLNALLVGAAGIIFALFPEIWCGNVGGDLQVIEHCQQSLHIIAPTYLFFALGLGGYFASQGLNTLKFPVHGALLTSTQPGSI